MFIVKMKCHVIKSVLSFNNIQHSHHKTRGVRYIIGRVSSIHCHTSTNDVIVHIQTHDPRVTSLVITRILESFPSTHFRSSAYFYIRSDEFKYLRDLPPLPGQKQPLKWERYIPPLVNMCSLCYGINMSSTNTPMSCSSSSSTPTHTSTSTPMPQTTAPYHERETSGVKSSI